jgi:hypothetical protein
MASKPLTIAEARRVVLDAVRPLDAVTVEVEDALGSVLLDNAFILIDGHPKPQTFGKRCATRIGMRS